MTTTASHSRWRLMQELERLAHGHDRADAALVRYAAASASASRRPVPERFDWWTIPALLTTAFVGWTSADALRTVTGGGVPFWVACLPGLALAVALIGMTVVAAAVARDAETRSDAVWPFVLSGVCVVGAAVWVTLWLDGIVRVARPVAFAAGVLFVVAVAAAAFGAVLYGGEPRTPGGPRTGRSPWTRMRRRAAEKALRSHERTWRVIAHQTGVLLADTAEARAVLLRLIDGGSLDGEGADVAVVPDDLDPVHALILTGLRDHHPRELSAALTRIDHNDD